MKIKRFRAGDLVAATHLIKDEFGLNAIILSQREVPLEEGGGVEITAGVKEEDLPQKNEKPDFQKALLESGGASSLPSAKAAKPSKAAVSAYLKTEQAFREEGEGGLKKELDSWGRDLSGGLEELKTLILDLAHRQSLSEKWRDRPDLVKLYRKLLDTGLSPLHAREILESAAQSVQAWGGDLLGHLRKTVKMKAADMSVSSPRALALVGPSGSGKTQSLINLAAFFRLKGKKAAAITLDTIRLGAADQLGQYLRIMGIGLKVCESHDELSEALEVFEEQDVVLIDTPSRDFQREERRLQMAEALRLASASALLVLPAFMKSGDLAQSLKKTAGWPLAGVIVTKLDETLNFGNLVDFIIEENPELAFFSKGPKTPDDFRPAAQESLMDMWLKDIG